MRYFTKTAGIIGIPDKKITSEIPQVENNEWEFAVQDHNANRAGKHYDLRLGDTKYGKAYSWAMRHWPKPGEKRLAIRQPDHTVKYMDWEGKIPKGYGAGTVKLDQRGKAAIHSSSPHKINFSVKEKQFTLIKTKDKKWLLLNREKVLDKNA